MTSPRAGGLGLVLFLALALTATLNLLKGGGHPLSEQVDYPLCDHISQATMLRLTGQPAQAYADRRNDSVMACEISLYAEMPPERLPGQVRVQLQTEAGLRRQAGFRQSLSESRETWLAEAAASGLDVKPVDGPWRNAAWFAYPNGSAGMLIEEDGVLLVLHAREVERSRLLDFAHSLVGELRAAP